ncbi:MAG: hypothetical protein ACREDH_03345 [Methylocella sp.]
MMSIGNYGLGYKSFLRADFEATRIGAALSSCREIYDADLSQTPALPYYNTWLCS